MRQAGSSMLLDNSSTMAGAELHTVKLGSVPAPACGKSMEIGKSWDALPAAAAAAANAYRTAEAWTVIASCVHFSK